MNKQLLKDTIKESGMSVKAIAEKSGMVRETLYNKIETGNFYASEISDISRVLRLTREERDAIFFKK
ncbi:XRE family transcriptional regulator [Mogibacterium timidum]|nr:XRE family transcriptional regulator [Mogibacterium timidum]